jgi:hypothetical protein
MLTFLLWLSPVIVIAVLVWKYRRTAAAREAARNARFKDFLGKTAAQGAVDAVPPVTGFDPAPVPAAIAATQAPTGFTARARLLTPPQTVLYYLLKSSLSDHEVLAQINVASVIDAPAGGSALEREARSRRLAAAVVDFVVCDKSFTVIALVQCAAHDASAAATLAFARACCKSAGVRWVEVAAHALPKRDEIRHLVLGA